MPAGRRFLERGIFFPGGQAAPDMAFLLIELQNLLDMVIKLRIELSQTLCNILMDRTLGYLKFFGRLAHRRVFLRNIGAQKNGPLLWIPLQLNPPPCLGLYHHVYAKAGAVMYWGNPEIASIPWRHFPRISNIIDLKLMAYRL